MVPEDTTERNPVTSAATDHFGFRLAACTSLYSEPDDSSPVLKELPDGTVVTVLQRRDDFLQVVTNEDRFGYILSSVPMSPVGARVVENWSTLLPDLAPSPTLTSAGILITGEPDARVPARISSDALPSIESEDEESGRSRQRQARLFLNRISKPSRSVDSAALAGLTSAALGMIGILVTYGIGGMTRERAGVFFVADVLVPLFLLSFGSPAWALGAFTLVFYAALIGNWVS